MGREIRKVPLIKQSEDGKEEEIEKFYLSKINDCYMWLKHN